MYLVGKVLRPPFFSVLVYGDAPYPFFILGYVHVLNNTLGFVFGISLRLTYHG